MIWDNVLKSEKLHTILHICSTSYVIKRQPFHFVTRWIVLSCFLLPPLILRSTIRTRGSVGTTPPLGKNLITTKRGGSFYAPMCGVLRYLYTRFRNSPDCLPRDGDSPFGQIPAALFLHRSVQLTSSSPIFISRRTLCHDGLVSIGSRFVLLHDIQDKIKWRHSLHRFLSVSATFYLLTLVSSI